MSRAKAIVGNNLYKCVEEDLKRNLKSRYCKLSLKGGCDKRLAQKIAHLSFMGRREDIEDEKLKKMAEHHLPVTL